MDEDGKEQFERSIGDIRSKIKKMVPGMDKEIKSDERILALMRAGLKVHPEESDFIELFAEKLVRKRLMFELTASALGK